MPEINLDIIKQAAERSAITFVQTFFAMFVVTDLSSAKGAATAAVAAAFSVAKSLVATKVGDKNSTSVI